MRRKIEAGFVLVFILISFFVRSVNPAEISIDDLLVPEAISLNDNFDPNDELSQKTNKEISIDDLLGPRDVFPFLPDNHRDSGTGKFNSFWPKRDF